MWFGRFDVFIPTVATLPVAGQYVVPMASFDTTGLVSGKVYFQVFTFEDLFCPQSNPMSYARVRFSTAVLELIVR